MIKRVLEFSQEPAHLSLKNGQLLVRQQGSDHVKPRVFPCEDLGMVCLDSPGSTYSHRALVELLDQGTVILICGANHMPIGQILPFPSHAEVVHRLNLQIRASKPLQKRLWQQIVRAKVIAQARNLEAEVCQRRLMRMARDVRSGDSSNMEAQAARYYWANFFGQNSSRKRRARARDCFNSMLNYGYSVLRAAMARALVIAGLYPAIGLHHRNRSNGFCLADDFMEPLRPLVDPIVRELIRGGQDELSTKVKRALLGVLSQTVETEDETGPLLVALHRVTASYVRCLSNDERRLVLPVAVE